MHLDNQLRPRSLATADEFTFCDTMQAQNADLNCVGKSLVWQDGDDPANDYNRLWRTIFTFNIGYAGTTPVGFIDIWTPFIFAMMGIIVHFQFEIKMISDSWSQVFAFYLTEAFFAQYGYAGNLGVFWGMWTCVAFLPFVLICIFVAREEKTTFEFDIPAFIADQEEKRQERIVRRQSSRASLAEGYNPDETTAKSNDKEGTFDEPEQVQIDVDEEDSNQGAPPPREDSSRAEEEFLENYSNVFTGPDHQPESVEVQFIEIGSSVVEVQFVEKNRDSGNPILDDEPIEVPKQQSPSSAPAASKSTNPFATMNNSDPQSYE